MGLTAIVISLALIEYVIFTILVGKARGTYKIDAPAVTGDPKFECYYRVQQNTLEQLVLFIPGMMIFSSYVRADVAAGLGVVFIIGRFLYFKGYVKDPSKRGIGFLLTFLPNVILIIGGLIGAAMTL